MCGNILKRPATRAFLIFTFVYAILLGVIFGGTWSGDIAAVQPDAATTYPLDHIARTWRNLLSGSAQVLPGEVLDLFVSPWLLQEFRYAIAVWFAALGLAYYLRGRGLDLLPAYAAGATYGLMGYTLTLFSAGHYGWFSWLTYGPFAFGLTDRAVRAGHLKHWMLLGAVLGWGAARQADMWFLFTVLTFAYGVWCLIREGRVCAADRLVARARGLALTALTAALIGAPAYMGALTESLSARDAQIAQSSRADTKQPDAAEAERWRFCTSWSLPPEDIAEFFWPRVHGDTSDINIIQLRRARGWRETTPYTGRLGMPIPDAQGNITRWSPYRQHALYMGLITWAFVLAAWIWGLRRNERALANRGEIIFWTVMGGITLLCALGCFTPFYRLVYALPVGNYLRAPVKFVHLVEFAVAALSGFGVAAVLTRFGNMKYVMWAVLACVAFNLIDLARIDALYLGPLDVTFTRLPNAAADDARVHSSGKVAVCVPPQQGGQLLRDSFYVHGVETADLAAANGNPFAAGAQFLFVTGELFTKNPALNAQLKSGRLKVVGTYALSSKTGLTRVPHTQAQTALLAITHPANVTPQPATSSLKRAFNYTSVLASLLLFGVLGATRIRRMLYSVR